ncbi:MAG: cytochrome d ubiquinol oxidase subunit II [Minisyncoccia bacterium]|jgi:cytochrome d ubiquinol oxidase subunit II
MTDYYIAATVTIVSLFIYAVLFSIECGAALFIFAPKLAGMDGDNLIRKYINPAWETTNVFLIFALLWLIAFFPGAAPIWGHALITPFLIFLVVMGIRSVGMLYVFYKEGDSRVMKFLLLVASLAAPMALAGGVLPFFILGSMPYGIPKLLLALCFAGMAFFTTLFISSSFFDYLAARNKHYALGSLALFTRSSMIAFIAIVFLSFWAFRNMAPRIAMGMQGCLPLIAILAVINLIFTFFIARRYIAAHFAFAIALFGVIFFSVMFSQLPYIIYPTVTIFSAFTDPTSAGIMLSASGIAALVILPSLGLLYYLVILKKYPGMGIDNKGCYGERQTMEQENCQDDGIH